MIITIAKHEGYILVWARLRSTRVPNTKLFQTLYITRDESRVLTLLRQAGSVINLPEPFLSISEPLPPRNML